ncbi:hypothetical protein Adt_40145 [Abeliophyllum distichum]|uniref:Uncharacterized protein n=1 Tax=Abeliophyllum distichum TaxID=126358 RepID=A0ABD1Q733_9LAMI
MEHPPRTDRPPKPPDIPSTLVGHLPSALPNLQTGPTPLELGLTPPISLSLANAAAISAGCATVGPPPISAPSSGEHFEGSIDGQSLVSTDSRPGQKHGSLNTHGPTFKSHPAPSSHAATWVESPPAHLTAPSMADNPRPENESQPNLPVPQSQPSAQAHLPFMGVPNANGLPLIQSLEPY